MLSAEHGLEVIFHQANIQASVSGVSLKQLFKLAPKQIVCSGVSYPVNIIHPGVIELITRTAATPPICGHREEQLVLWCNLGEIRHGVDPGR